MILAAPTVSSSLRTSWKTMSPRRSEQVTGKVGRTHEVVEHFRQRALLLLRAEHVEAGADPVGGREERQALHVVPVNVGEQGGASERPVEGLGVTERAQSGAEIEDDGRLAFER